ncbi:SGNH/GDSL hydrolase family protein [Candidatus Woesearchaeota archaeon]|nr:SGNH/GDSL hydrolase family protein [Candidatus Woesearchaeota archaeon]
MVSGFAKRLLLFVAIVLLCLLALEFASRLLFPQYSETVSYDDRYLYKYLPHAERVFVNPLESDGKHHLLKVNSFGFRDEEFSAEKKGKVRIIVYGDSFIAGDFFDLNATFAKELESVLNKANKDVGRAGVEVLNGGVTGYGPDQVSLRMEDEIGLFNPDAVIVSIFVGNDFGDNIRDKIYRLDASGNAVLNNYFLSPSMKAKKAIYQRSHLIRVLLALSDTLRWSSASSMELSYSQNLAKNREECTDFVVNMSNVVTNLFADTFDVDISVEPESPCVEYKMNLMAGIIRRMKEVADAKGVHLLLLVIPSKYEVEEPDFSEAVASLNASLNLNNAGYDRESRYLFLDNVARASNISYVDLFPIFLERSRAEQLFWENGGHWNVAGQSLAVQLVKEELMLSNLSWLS